LIRLAVRVAREHAELVLAELLELLPDGVEEVDLDGATVEFAAYGAPGELPLLPALQAAAGGALVAITTSEVAEDWSERWRCFHRPVLLPAPASRAGSPTLPALHIRPPWEPPADGGGLVEEIVVDPGQAFGTGAHATTRLCLALLLELAARAPQRGALLDIGTGSGVLAIAAARLGFAPVSALDNDPESVSAARANALVNGVAVEVRRLDLRAAELPAHAAPVVCANLLRPLLIELAQSLRFTPRALIAGGLLHGEVDEVAGAFAQRLGLRVLERREGGEWSALLLAPALS
jgi:ribosomal protein L11 methyltransferase